ncbi:MAG: thymidine kinase, partial [Gammaproteobacteria bacterium]|nr:thymidine kinase [Gammaproteobacteria bacterium]
DALVELKTICHCGRIRINEKGERLHDGVQFEVGGNERYISVCRRHHREDE